MKKIYYNLLMLLSVSLFFIACQEEDQVFGDITVPSNLTLDFEIRGLDNANPNGDGSGFVTFTALADNAITYSFNFGDNTPVEVAPYGSATHRFNLTGTNTYNVIVVASGTGGVKTSTTVTIDVFSAFDDQQLKDFLSGGSGMSKTWYPKLDQNGHLGVGPTLVQDIADDGTLNGHWFPQYDSTNAFGKCSSSTTDCFCEFTLNFGLDTNNNLTLDHINNGQTFFNWAHGSVVGQTFGMFDDTCFTFDTSLQSDVSLAPSSTDWSQVADPSYPIPRGTVMNFSNDGFMGYYTGVNSYEVLEVDNDFLYVRFYDNVNPVLAWYQMFTTTDPNGTTGACSSSTGLTGASGSGINDVLVWADEFNDDGAPCSDNWTYDIGAGGWGNGEVQNYTSNADNVIVDGGVLKITAKANGSGYTSSRLKSENIFEFTYGRVDVRAKLPASQGTWPAIWMLGANFDTVSWPNCGEIDIMEQTGQNKNITLGTLHYPGMSGGSANGGSTTVSTSTSQFHVYSVEWKAGTIDLMVDNVVFHTVTNSSALPFNSDFFFILNVAMGGTLGGTIDPTFIEDTMEIDYIRVYQ